MDPKGNKKTIKFHNEEEIKKLKDEIEKLKKNLEDYKNKYLRALADYQNLEKHVQTKKEEFKKTANRDLILKLLPFLDSLDKAGIFIKDEGLKIAKNNFYQTLKDAGLEIIEVLGQEFDPNLAEAVELVKGNKDNLVTEVISKGYKFNNIILRVARVKVSKKVTN